MRPAVKNAATERQYLFGVQDWSSCHATALGMDFQMPKYDDKQNLKEMRRPIAAIISTTLPEELDKTIIENFSRNTSFSVIDAKTHDGLRAEDCYHLFLSNEDVAIAKIQ